MLQELCVPLCETIEEHVIPPCFIFIAPTAFSDIESGPHVFMKAGGG